MVVPTLWNVALALLPSVVIAAMQTTIIRASMTAYSTAVGPSSFFKNAFKCRSMGFLFRLFGRIGPQELTTDRAVFAARGLITEPTARDSNTRFQTNT